MKKLLKKWCSVFMVSILCLCTAVTSASPASAYDIEDHYDWGISIILDSQEAALFESNVECYTHLASIAAGVLVGKANVAVAVFTFCIAEAMLAVGKCHIRNCIIKGNGGLRINVHLPNFFKPLFCTIHET